MLAFSPMPIPAFPVPLRRAFSCAGPTRLDLDLCTIRAECLSWCGTLGPRVWSSPERTERDCHQRWPRRFAWNMYCTLSVIEWINHKYNLPTTKCDLLKVFLAKSPIHDYMGKIWLRFTVLCGKEPVRPELRHSFLFSCTVLVDLRGEEGCSQSRVFEGYLRMNKVITLEVIEIIEKWIQLTRSWRTTIPLSISSDANWISASSFVFMLSRRSPNLFCSRMVDLVSSDKVFIRTCRRFKALKWGALYSEIETFWQINDIVTKISLATFLNKSNTTVDLL